MSGGTKQQFKQFSITCAEDACLVLGMLISGITVNLEKYKEYASEAESLLESTQEEYVPAKEYDDVNDKLLYRQREILKFTADHQSSSFSYIDLRKILEKQKYISSPLSEEVSAILSEFLDVRNWTFHNPQSLMVAAKEAAHKDIPDELKEIAHVEDLITDQIRRNGKQANVSMFAFTATPKPTTIQLFGRLNTRGQREAFHVYSMKQAIEEGFILDVLQNYTTYDTFYQINKEIEEDPQMKTASAKRQIARFVELHETNIAQRVEVIVEHFRTTVMPELGGMAKAMVITASRQGAVKYRQAFEDYTKKKGYTDIKALVAFSGKVKLPDDETEYTEASMNGFPEDRLTKEFDKDDYQVLLVANKYQTGFDQPKLCAMYAHQSLPAHSGRNASDHRHWRIQAGLLCG